jgi:Rrf2 family transcriptional regulator, iron-sulfur cluster assembly transcription factor
MLWSSACDYAIRAATHLAERPDGLVQLKDLARDESIPAPFVGKILQALVKDDILRSVRGPRGGYGLSREPQEITLLMIMTAVDGTRQLEACAVGLGVCSKDQRCPLHEAFEPVRASIRHYLETTTLADMRAARAKKRVRQARPPRRTTAR